MGSPLKEKVGGFWIAPPEAPECLCSGHIPGATGAGGNHGEVGDLKFKKRFAIFYWNFFISEYNEIVDLDCLRIFFYISYKSKN